MAYVTNTQLRDRLGTELYARLTDRVNGNTADDAVAEQLIAEAEGVLNSYLARRYATPIDLGAWPEVADVLAARVLDEAEYLAWRGSPFTSTVPDRVGSQHEAVLAWGQAVAERRLDLPSAGIPEGPAARDDGPRYRATPRTFTADELDGL